jgi:hypothetical protein
MMKITMMKITMMKNKDILDEAHISIAMPDDGSGEIVRFSWAGINKLNDALEAHLKREVLTDLPHSPSRTAMRSIES